MIRKQLWVALAISVLPTFTHAQPKRATSVGVVVMPVTAESNRYGGGIGVGQTWRRGAVRVGVDVHGIFLPASSTLTSTSDATWHLVPGVTAAVSLHEVKRYQLLLVGSSAPWLTVLRRGSGDFDFGGITASAGVAACTRPASRALTWCASGRAMTFLPGIGRRTRGSTWPFLGLSLSR